eukprot:8558266-Pyramimonas_sp.AAC.1
MSPSPGGQGKHGFAARTRGARSSSQAAGKVPVPLGRECRRETARPRPGRLRRGLLAEPGRR